MSCPVGCSDRGDCCRKDETMNDYGDNLPLAVSCPKGCAIHSLYHETQPITLRPIMGKHPNGTIDMMTVMCPRCGFECWANKELRDKIGKLDQPYWDGHKVIIP